MWKRVQNLRWYIRWPIKWAIVGVAVFLVSYPNPALFVRHVEHWRNTEALIDPNYPGLEPWTEELRAQLKPGMSPPKALKTVERFVYEKVPYKWDWETWGASDYLPTLAEVLQMGAEDCDGRAVVAASLLRALGYKADLVTDFAHVWVKSGRDETMSPGKRKSVVVTDEGVQVYWDALTDTLPKAWAYGISPFPLGRELIVLAVVWLVLLQRGVGWPVRLIGLIMMLEGLLFLRVAGRYWSNPVVWAQWWGIGHLAVATLGLMWLGRRARRSTLLTAGRVSAGEAAPPPGGSHG